MGMEAMTASFRVYIDEAGDEGFKFRNDLAVQRSSDWFVLAALITRKVSDLETVKVIDSVRTELGLAAKKHVHWVGLKHPQKVRYSQIIAGQKVRVIQVAVHKPSLLEQENFGERYRLYFYLVRYLLERVSWFVRDQHNPAKYGGDGTGEIVFSNRQGMPYEEMKAYLRRLDKQRESGADIRVDLERLPLEQISTFTPGRCMGLQLADAAAGALFNALERDRYGNTEPRYLREILPVVYRHESKVLGYGLKIVPREAASLAEQQTCLGWLKELA
jgi:hypothetical protein